MQSAKAVGLPGNTGLSLTYHGNAVPATVRGHASLSWNREAHDRWRRGPGRTTCHDWLHSLRFDRNIDSRSGVVPLHRALENWFGELFECELDVTFVRLPDGVKQRAEIGN